MKILLNFTLLFYLAVSAAAQSPPAEKVLVTYDWNDLLAQHPLPDCEVVTLDGLSVLKIDNTNNTPQNFTLLVLTNSSLIRKTDFVLFDVKYDLIRQLTNTVITHSGSFQRIDYLDGVLALNFQFPPAAMGGDEVTNDESETIWGAANWTRKNFGIRSTHSYTSAQIALTLHLDGAGTVYLRPLKLVGIPRNWWSVEQIGYIGGIGGSLLGCLGALIGCLAGMGKARSFVLATTKLLIVLGIGLTIGGVAAQLEKQPYAVWFPLVLSGGILTFVMAVNLYPIKRRYDDQEIHRMTSLDASGR